MENNMIAKIIEEGHMSKIYTGADGAVVVGAWSLDVGTKERRLRLAVVYPDGDISPMHEYSKSKLNTPKALSDLSNLDGIAPKMLEDIFKVIMEKQQALPVQKDRNGKCSVLQAHKKLSEYVKEYEEPRKVFVKDGYGNILAAYLQTVIDKLELGFTRMELQKNFQMLNLLRTNGKEHIYSYAINLGGVNSWFFSFSLLEEDKVA